MEVLSAVMETWDPIVVTKVLCMESQGRQHALSPRGAIGYMQVMPYHFRRGEDPWDPDTNIQKGAQILLGHFLREGNIRDALICYNAGRGKMGKPLPMETKQYLKKYQQLGGLVGDG